MSVEVEIRRFILEELLFDTDDSRIDPDESLVESRIIDSFALMRLVYFLEERFGISVEDNEINPKNFETINVIKGFVEKKHGAT